MLSVNVLLFMEGPWWVARGRERDIVGQGASRQEAIDGFCDCLAAHVISDLEEGREPLADVPSWDGEV